jgi:hypothetical protein
MLGYTYGVYVVTTLHCVCLAFEHVRPMCILIPLTPYLLVDTASQLMDSRYSDYTVVTSLMGSQARTIHFSIGTRCFTEISGWVKG